MFEHNIHPILQEEFDEAVNRWGQAHAARFRGGAARVSEGEAEAYRGQAEGIKRIASRLRLSLDNDDLSDSRLHKELVKHKAVDY